MNMCIDKQYDQYTSALSTPAVKVPAERILECMTKILEAQNKSNMKAKRISKGHYEYRGYKIVCIGYYPPE